jgi:hypothetical protein
MAGGERQSLDKSLIIPQIDHYPGVFQKVEKRSVIPPYKSKMHSSSTVLDKPGRIIRLDGLDIRKFDSPAEQAKLQVQMLWGNPDLQCTVVNQVKNKEEK